MAATPGGGEIHRICYQDDHRIVTACGVIVCLSRKEVEDSPFFTIWRGNQTCPECPDEVDELPDAVRWIMAGKGYRESR